MYVNTASNDLNLNNGAVAKSLLKAGGQALQDECTSYVTQNGNLSAGSVIVTGPGKLPCKKVVHTVGMLYNGSQSEKVMNYCVAKCKAIILWAKLLIQNAFIILIASYGTTMSSYIVVVVEKCLCNFQHNNTFYAILFTG